MARSNQLASLAVDIVINARRFRSTLRQTRGDLKKTSDSSRQLALNITRIGLAASAFLIIQRAANLAITVIKETTLAFAALEKQIIDIEKIAKIDISQQFFGLARELPSASFQNISEVMAGAARAGIQGAEGLKEFSKAVIILSEVSGDIVPAEASIGIAQLLKNFDLGTEKALELVNNIDTLSDNFVTTSGAILTSSKRLAGFAETIGLSVNQLNALVAALLQTGATATTVRTTLGQLFTKIIPKSLEAGRALGLTGDELINFATVLKTDAIEGLKLFINTLKKLPEAKAQEFLKEFGIAGSRTQLVLKLLAKTTEGELDRALKLSADSINDTSGVLLKYERVAQSADTTIKNLSKQWTIFKANIGDTAVFETIISVLKAFNRAQSDFKTKKPIENIEDVKSLRNIAQARIVKLKADLKKFKKDFFVPGFVIEMIESELETAEESFARLERLHKALLDKQVADQEKASDAIIAEKQREIDFAEQAIKEQRQQISDIKTLLSGLPTLKTGLAAKLERIEKQRIKAREDLVGLGVKEGTVLSGFGDIDLRFERLSQAAKDSAQAIIDEKKERERLKEVLKKERAVAGGFGLGGGPLGEAFSIIQGSIEAAAAFEAAGLKGSKALGDAADDLLDFQLAQINKPEKQKAQFRGLTQAWKDAVIGVNKKDTKLKELQTKFAEEFLRVLKKNEIGGQIGEIIDLLKEKGNLVIAG